MLLAVMVLIGDTRGERMRWMVWMDQMVVIVLTRDSMLLVKRRRRNVAGEGKGGRRKRERKNGSRKKRNQWGKSVPGVKPVWNSKSTLWRENSISSFRIDEELFSLSGDGIRKREKKWKARKWVLSSSYSLPTVSLSSYSYSHVCHPLQAHDYLSFSPPSSFLYICISKHCNTCNTTTTSTTSRRKVKKEYNGNNEWSRERNHEWKLPDEEKTAPKLGERNCVLSRNGCRLRH